MSDRRAGGPGQEAPATEGAPILVVEDDDGVRQTLVRILETRGYRVVSAADGPRALALLDAGPAPCLVVLDFMMPGMDGGTLLARLRERLGDVMPPAVLVTACDAWRRAADLGAHEGLAKPFRVGELLAAVDRWRRTVAGEAS